MIYYIRILLNYKLGNTKFVKNIPRLFIDKKIHTGDKIPVEKSIVHYLTHVMRRNDCLCFNDGYEFNAYLSDDNKYLVIANMTEHPDPSNNITLYFAPIKKLDDLLNMATQMGVKNLQPVITERVTVQHINWERMKKIIIEAAEQSNRNSIPNLFPPIKLSDINLSEIAFADERAAYGKEIPKHIKNITEILVGPEGGFSEAEFNELDKAGAKGINLGKTILRAELAAAIAISRIIE